MSEHEILTESGVNREGKPFCVVKWNGREGQFTPAEIRRFGLVCLATAEAAEHDAAFVLWAQEKMELELPQAAALMGEQRQYRARLGHGGVGDDPDTG